jgi:hypothetical protein
MRVVSLLAVIIYLSTLACGQSSRTMTAGQVLQDEAPVNRRAAASPRFQSKPLITLQRALKLVEEYIEKEKVDVSSHYLLEARMVLRESGKGGKESHWYFFWDHDSLASGAQLEFTVSMAGKVMRLASW